MLTACYHKFVFRAEVDQLPGLSISLELAGGCLVRSVVSVKYLKPPSCATKDQYQKYYMQMQHSENKAKSICIPVFVIFIL